MNSGYIILIAILFGFLLIWAQRIEEKTRRTVRRFIALLAFILWVWRWHLRTEHVLGLVLALFVSFLFWLLIGRYNPVGNSDEIKVFGMND
jgi:hypothetical protein